MSLHNAFFGILPVEYCTWFFILMVIGFITAAASVGFILFNLVVGNKKSGYSTTAATTFLFNGLITYFVNRLLYSMCASSISN